MDEESRSENERLTRLSIYGAVHSSDRCCVHASGSAKPNRTDRSAQRGSGDGRGRYRADRYPRHSASHAAADVHLHTDSANGDHAPHTDPNLHGGANAQAHVDA